MKFSFYVCRLVEFAASLWFNGHFEKPFLFFAVCRFWFWGVDSFTGMDTGLPGTGTVARHRLRLGACWIITTAKSTVTEIGTEIETTGTGYRYRHHRVWHRDKDRRRSGRGVTTTTTAARLPSGHSQLHARRYWQRMNIT